MDEISLTTVESITAQAAEAMEDVTNALLELEMTGIKYIGKYDEYNNLTLKDADVLKAKMKNAVIMAVNDAIQ